MICSRILKSTVIFVLLLLLGCAATPKAERGAVFSGLDAPPADAALVYIYRNSGVLSWGGETQVFADGREIVRLDNRGYTVLAMQPKCYELTQAWPGQVTGSVVTEPLEACVEAGRRHFFRISPFPGNNRGVYMAGSVMMNAGSMVSQIVPASEEYALRKDALQNCNRFEAVQTP